jgi:hypothetical protein
MNVRYLFLGFAACASIVTATPSHARPAWMPEPCNKPVAQLTSEQREFCNGAERFLGGVEDAVRQAREEEEKERSLYPCGAITIYRGGEAEKQPRPCK